MRMKRKGIAGVVAIMAFALAACPGEREVDEAPLPEPTPAPMPEPGVAVELPPGVTEEMVAQGQQLFTGQGNCYTCHGMDARGTQLGPDLTDDRWILIDGSFESIENNIRTGVPQPREHPAPMPPMGGAQLGDDQIRALAAYVYSISR